MRVIKIAAYPAIEAERYRATLTVEELSQKIGICSRTYMNWQSGRTIPADKLREMADLFGTTMDYLVGRTA